MKDRVSWGVYRKFEALRRREQGEYSAFGTLSTNSCGTLTAFLDTSSDYLSTEVERIHVSGEMFKIDDDWQVQKTLERSGACGASFCKKKGAKRNQEF